MSLGSILSKFKKSSQMPQGEESPPVEAQPSAAQDHLGEHSGSDKKKKVATIIRVVACFVVVLMLSFVGVYGFITDWTFQQKKKPAANVAKQSQPARPPASLGSLDAQPKADAPAAAPASQTLPPKPAAAPAQDVPAGNATAGKETAKKIVDSPRADVSKGKPASVVEMDTPIGKKGVYLPAKDIMTGSTRELVEIEEVSKITDAKLKHQKSKNELRKAEEELGLIELDSQEKKNAIKQKLGIGGAAKRAEVQLVPPTLVSVQKVNGKQMGTFQLASGTIRAGVGDSVGPFTVDSFGGNSAQLSAMETVTQMVNIKGKMKEQETKQARTFTVSMKLPGQYPVSGPMLAGQQPQAVGRSSGGSTSGVPMVRTMPSPQQLPSTPMSVSPSMPAMPSPYGVR